MSTTGKRRTLSEAEMLAGQRLPVVLRVTAATTRVTNESSQVEDVGTAREVHYHAGRCFRPQRPVWL